MQEHWSGLPCPPPGDLLDPGIEPASLTSPALAGGFFTTSTTWEAHSFIIQFHNIWLVLLKIYILYIFIILLILFALFYWYH